MTYTESLLKLHEKTESVLGLYLYLLQIEISIFVSPTVSPTVIPLILQATEVHSVVQACYFSKLEMKQISINGCL